jgi:hypothetical protein
MLESRINGPAVPDDPLLQVHERRDATTPGPADPPACCVSRHPQGTQDQSQEPNNALVYEPAVLEDGVFVGPAVVFTNDYYPRAITPDGKLKGGADWVPVGVTVRHGASVGARAVCVAPLTIGRWALVAAGSVVTKDVADFSPVAGVPARHIRWVGKAGVPLERDAGGAWRCPQTGRGSSSPMATVRRRAAATDPADGNGLAVTTIGSEGGFCYLEWGFER